MIGHSSRDTAIAAPAAPFRRGHRRCPISYADGGCCHAALPDGVCDRRGRRPCDRHRARLVEHGDDRALNPARVPIRLRTDDVAAAAERDGPRHRPAARAHIRHVFDHRDGDRGQPHRGRDPGRYGCWLGRSLVLGVARTRPWHRLPRGLAGESLANRPGSRTRSRTRVSSRWPSRTRRADARSPPGTPDRYRSDCGGIYGRRRRDSRSDRRRDERSRQGARRTRNAKPVAPQPRRFCAAQGRGHLACPAKNGAGSNAPDRAETRGDVVWLLLVAASGIGAGGTPDVLLRWAR